jgi:hypothetical protein
MKKILLLFLFIYNFNLYAQTNWAPIGAKWYYGVLENPTTGPDQGYLLFESIKDTLIKSKNCKVIHKTMHYSSGSYIDQGYEYMYSDTNKVYQLIEDKFYMLYDFVAQKGDHWITRIPKGTMDNSEDTIRTIIVDSIDQMIISMDTLKVLYVSVPEQAGEAYWYFKNPIIEKIGAMYMFLGIWGLWDINIPKLRCYSDNTITYKVPDSESCDTIITAIKQPTALLDNIIMYPNPTKNIVRLDFSDDKLSLESLKLFDVNGRCLISKSGFISSSDKSVILNIEDLSAGVYNLLLLFKDITISAHLKIIKQ